MHKVSAIVPAFNEEKKVSNVLIRLLESKYIDQVICVNDGSSDRTSEIARKTGAFVIDLKDNKGKAFAIASGIKKSKGEIVLFVDADITGLTESAIKKLVQPLKSGDYDAAIGFRPTIFEKIFFKPFSGERAYFKNDLIPHVKKFEKKGYGLELYLNYAFRNKRVKVFPIKGVKNSFKQEKQSFIAATKLDIKEIGDIFSEALKQNPSYLINSYLCPFYVRKPNVAQIWLSSFPLSLTRKIPTLVESFFLVILLILPLISFSAIKNLSNSSSKIIIDQSISSYKKYEGVLVSSLSDSIKQPVLLKEKIVPSLKQIETLTTSFLSS